MLPSLLSLALQDLLVADMPLNKSNKPKSHKKKKKRKEQKQSIFNKKKKKLYPNLFKKFPRKFPIKSESLI